MHLLRILAPKDMSSFRDSNVENCEQIPKIGQLLKCSYFILCGGKKKNPVDCEYSFSLEENTNLLFS